jgi:formylglycine-generating enzyme required for sulfatase activity
MSQGHEFETDLRKMIGRGQVVAVVGSGVSAATTSRAPTWRGLITSAVERCRTLGAGDKWCQRTLGLLEPDSDADMLLSAAELVHQKLREHGGEFARWLRDTFAELRPDNPTVIQLLTSLGTPLVTTNYDDLIEKVTSLKHVTWKDSRNVARVVRGEDQRVLHLHGHWDEPDSVVLGIRSYEAVKGSEHTQAVMRALGITKSFLFIGCGDEGLGDPNFGNFLSWLKAIETDAGVEHRHYRLVRKQDEFEPQGRLYPLVYGNDFADLPRCLERLRPQAEPLPGRDQRKPAVRVLAPLPKNIAHYLDCLAAKTATITLLGMGRSLQVELPIDEAYVPLRTTMARSLEQRPIDRFGEGHAEYEESVDLGEVFRKAVELRLRGVVVLGEPGSGKTTGARQLAWRLASRQSLPEDVGLPSGTTPVLLRFRHLRGETLADKNGLRTFLEAETHCDEAPDALASPGQDLWNGGGGGLLWILDGLDEVIDPDARKKVSGWVRKALEGRPQDYFLVTCRFQGYFREGVSLGPKFVEFHVRPLDDQQIERFVRDWFSAAYGKLLGSGPRATLRAQEDGDALLEILARPAYQAGHIRELCTNPLLLTILCIVFHEERKLPTGRAELYAHCVRVLLEYWRRDLYTAESGTSLQAYDAAAAQAVLGRLAWWMHQEQDRTAAPLADLAAEAALGLADVSPNSGLGGDGGGFLQRMRDEAGILAMAGEGRCGFLHLSFQEYLAAEHAAREGFARMLAPKAMDSWWREVALLSLRCSRPHCEAFFREMLKAGIAENHPDLAQRCVEESLYFTSRPFVQSLRRARPADVPARRAHDTRVAAILRLLRERAEQVPELEGVCRRLAEAEDQETRGFAREILARLGIEVSVEPTERGVHVDERTGISFVAIPAGEFQMGSKKGFEWEQPVHRVRITHGFLLGKYPVTNSQYGRFLEAAGKSVEKPAYWGDRRFNQPEQPVVGVSWDEARAYCEWAGGRLPTEAEWEYACRAGTKTEYSFGDDAELLGEYAWFDKNSGGQSQPVGAKKPNPWGLHDMHGNVWEWCADWFDHAYYARSPTDDPSGPEGGSFRVFRGGCWCGYARGCRAANRIGRGPSSRGSGLGFRLAGSVSSPSR